ncbi:hypothetical protein L204_103972 [Cryptococcus depauperatus]
MFCYNADGTGRVRFSGRTHKARWALGRVCRAIGLGGGSVCRSARIGRCEASFGYTLVWVVAYVWVAGGFISSWVWVCGCRERFTFFVFGIMHIESCEKMAPSRGALAVAAASAGSDIVLVEISIYFSLGMSHRGTGAIGLLRYECIF